MSLQKNKDITFYKILEVVCHFFDVSQEDVLGPSRQADIVRARQAAAYLLREKLKYPYPKIAKKLGGRDHTTAIYFYKKVKKVLEKDEKSEKEMEKIWNFLITSDYKEEKIDGLDDFKREKKKIKPNRIPFSPDEYIRDLRAKNISPLNLERQKLILEKYRDGFTLEKIGYDLNLTRERIRQIIYKGMLYNAKELLKEGVVLDLKEFMAEEKRVHSEAFTKRHFKPKVEPAPIVKQEKRWSKYYDSCRNCGTSSTKHQSHGYCRKCFYKTKLFKEIQRSSRLRNGETWKKRISDYLKEYYKRPEVVARLKKRTDLRYHGGNREKALMRDSYRCTVCGIDQKESMQKYKRDLYVDHINGKSNDLADLVTRCKGCHARAFIHKSHEKKSR